MSREEILKKLRDMHAQYLDCLEACISLVMAERAEGAPVAAPAPVATSGDDFLSLGDVAQLYNVSQTTVYRWIKAGRFPRGKYLGPRSRRWSRGELEAWRCANEMM